ncbi:MAG: hypothetical protein OEU51_05155 [Gammaproteobacteria bacterium]|nr:hypothetical protein [Gammaproteobacteria bacterium]
MNDPQRTPGVSRQDRVSAAGLARLDRQLKSGSQISDPVLAQWIRRYGDAAREIIKANGRYRSDLESAS